MSLNSDLNEDVKVDKVFSVVSELFENVLNKFVSLFLRFINTEESSVDWGWVLFAWEEGWFWTDISSSFARSSGVSRSFY